MVDLNGKTALITGAGQGVGQGIALALARAGATIAVTGRTESKLVETCRIITERGGKAIPIACNVRDADDCTRTVAAVVVSSVDPVGIDGCVPKVPDAGLANLGKGDGGQLDAPFGETLYAATIKGLEVETTGLN